MREKKIKARALVEIEWELEDVIKVPSKKEFEAHLKDWVITWLDAIRVKIKESEISEVEGRGYERRI
jgi:hypothetical protein